METTKKITEKEALASLRVLVCLAKADGTIDVGERAAMQSALEAIPGEPASLDTFLAEDRDLDALLGEITARDARERTFEAAYGILHAGRTPSAKEALLLDRVRAKLEIGEEKASLTKRLFEETKDTVLLSHIDPIADPERRAKEVDQDVLKYSILSAVLGAFPIPGVSIATDLAVVGLQVKLVRDIGQYWGHKVDRKAAKSLLAGVGLGTGARIAVANLAKLVPGWGSAFGAASSFASTWAIGRIANRWFENDGKLDLKLLRKQLKDEEKLGREAYARNEQAIAKLHKEREASIKSLNEELRSGKITQEEYERRVADMA